MVGAYYNMLERATRTNLTLCHERKHEERKRKKTSDNNARERDDIAGWEEGRQKRTKIQTITLKPTIPAALSLHLLHLG